uniref:DNA primase small subunit PriS n=1 Tax=Ignisphaera aggregans TaxID=334771 RepID=A0A7C5XJS0_9CREN
MGNENYLQHFKIYEDIFRKYYSKADLILPSDFYIREIALQPLYTESYIRHLSFSTISELRKTVTEKVPRHLYYSSAKYQEPANTSMDEKKWLGSDLVFDIDANDVPECIEENNVIAFRFCRACGYVTNDNLKHCPRCNSELQKFEHVNSKCIYRALSYLEKLIDIIENDFNFNTLKASFSGNRGFHLIVELNNPYDGMNSEIRREIVSYIRLDKSIATYIKNYLLGSNQKKTIPLPPRINEGGIRRRIAKELLTKSIDDLTKKYILGQLNKIHFTDAVKMYRFLESNLDEALKSASIPIDPKVTIDVTHLVRVPNSINGKTGWIAYNMKKLDVSEFVMDPSILSPENLRFKVRIDIDLPKLEIIDKEFTFTRNEEVVLEYAYASYLIFKGVAIPIEVKR